jgi:hypothetical protein
MGAVGSAPQAVLRSDKTIPVVRQISQVRFVIMGSNSGRLSVFVFPLGRLLWTFGFATIPTGRQYLDP